MLFRRTCQLVIGLNKEAIAVSCDGQTNYLLTTLNFCENSNATEHRYNLIITILAVGLVHVSRCSGATTTFAICHAVTADVPIKINQDPHMVREWKLNVAAGYIL